MDRELERELRRSGAYERAEARILERRALFALAESLDVLVPDELVQTEVDAERRRLGLESVTATRSWLEERGLSLDDLATEAEARVCERLLRLELGDEKLAQRLGRPFAPEMHSLFDTRIWVEIIADARKRNRALEVGIRRRWHPTEDDLSQYNGFSTYHESPEELLELPQAREVLEIVKRRVVAYLVEQGVHVEDYRVDVGHFWANSARTGAARGSHLHLFSSVAGTYYVKVASPDQGGRLVFRDPRDSQRMLDPTVYADLEVPVVPEEGMLVLFPAWLRHRVEPHSGPDERISLSFNVLAVPRSEPL